MSEFHKKLKETLLLTLKKLEEREAYINNLNIFPIPDGDTGTNMCKTLKDTIESKEKLNEIDFLNYVKEKIILKAHGNSGIIFSQFLKGFIEEILKVNENDFEKLKKGFENGYKLSFEILDNPVEGTIITIIRKAKDALKESSDLYNGIRNAYFKGVDALKKTPELLPILKEAGVVDAGGEGFVVFLESLLFSFLNEEYERNDRFSENELVNIWRKRPNYRNCVEVFLKRKENINIERGDLKRFGNSLILIDDVENIKIHIHTNDVDGLINYLKEFGEIQEIVSRDMIKQQLRFLHDVQISIITFSISDKISDLLYSLGSTIVIEKEEKPSVEEIIEFVQDVPSREVLIIPHDSDLFLTLRKVKEKSSKKVEYVETESIGECIEALINFNSSLNLYENLEKMREEIKKIKSGIIAKANKDILSSDLEVKTFEYFGTLNKNIIVKGDNFMDVAINLFRKIKIKNGALLLIYGNSIDFDMIEFLRFKILNNFKDINLTIYDGGQKFYDLIYSYKE